VSPLYCVCCTEKSQKDKGPKRKEEAFCTLFHMMQRYCSSTQTLLRPVSVSVKLRHSQNHYEPVVRDMSMEDTWVVVVSPDSRDIRIGQLGEV
jgi:hypothetical protein